MDEVRGIREEMFDLHLGLLFSVSAILGRKGREGKGSTVIQGQNQEREQRHGIVRKRPCHLVYICQLWSPVSPATANYAGTKHSRAGFGVLAMASQVLQCDKPAYWDVEVHG